MRGEGREGGTEGRRVEFCLVVLIASLFLPPSLPPPPEGLTPELAGNSEIMKKILPGTGGREGGRERGRASGC